MNIYPYDNGGIPLYYPLQGGYKDNITLNDACMINYIRCCNYILNSSIKDKIDTNKISLLQSNYDKSLNCLLDLQVTIDGIKTIWPQQADPVTLLPATGRSFEVESLSTGESLQILVYLMSLKYPSDKIKSAIISVTAAVMFQQLLSMKFKVRNVAPVFRSSATFSIAETILDNPNFIPFYEKKLYNVK